MKQNKAIASILALLSTSIISYGGINCPNGFPSASCGTQPSEAVRNGLSASLPLLLNSCSWTILSGSSSTYNCIAWSVGDSSHWYDPDDIDEYFGDNDGVFEISDMDAFYLSKRGWTPTASGPSDAEAMYYSRYHGAKKRTCGCLGPTIMYESKLGPAQRIEHRWDLVNSTTYGTPIRFYK
jgi:hypothetical protein